MSQPKRIPRTFVWTKFGTEAGQSIGEILHRKEEERIASDGIFYWGIGNAVGPSILELLRQSDEPQVLFSPIKSAPRLDDVAPESVVAWTAAAGLDGEPHLLPLWTMITSRFNTGRRRHYALVCKSDSSLVNELGATERAVETIAIGELSNLLTGRRLGSSQVTAVVQRGSEAHASSTEYSVKFRAKLVFPYFIQLSEPKPVAPAIRSWATTSMKAYA